MAAKWKWNTTNIYVSEEDQSRDVKRAELQVLDAVESTFHYFGSSSKRIRIKGLVIGNTDRDAIATDAQYGTARTLTTPWETLGGCYLDKTIKFTAHKYSGGTIDGTTYSVDTTPIYDLEAEVIVVVAIA